MIADRVRSGQGGHDFVGPFRGILGVVQLREDDHELVTAIATHGVRAADARRDLLADAAQERISQQVSPRVVDRFEMIEIQEEHGHPLLMTMRQSQRRANRSASNERFGKSVSGSWLARWDIRSATARTALTSRSTIRVPMSRPAGLRMVVAE